MICYRVEDSDERSVSSTPYCFCTKCGVFIANSYFKYCPWCGHEFEKHPVNHISRKDFDRIIKSKESM